MIENSRRPRSCRIVILVVDSFDHFRTFLLWYLILSSVQHSNPLDLVIMAPCHRSFTAYPKGKLSAVHSSFIAAVSKHSYLRHRNLPIVSSSRPHKHSPQIPATCSGSQTRVSALRNTVATASVGYLEVNSHSEGIASGATRGATRGPGHLKPKLLERVVEERRYSEQQQEAYQMCCSTCCKMLLGFVCFEE